MRTSRLISRESTGVAAAALRWIPAIAIALIIAFGSSFGSEDIGRVPVRIPDKLAHLIQYAFLGAAVMFALAPVGRTAGKGVVLRATLIAIVYGVSDELHQAFVPSRDPSLGDLAADAAGALLGAWGLWRIGMTGRRQ